MHLEVNIYICSNTIGCYDVTLLVVCLPKKIVSESSERVVGVREVVVVVN